MQKDNYIVPFLKWAGGKRQLLPAIANHIPNGYITYYEPFVGGGAVLFYLQPSSAIINDYNSELINVYKVIKDHPDELIEDLKKHKNESKYFYQIRALDRSNQFEKLTEVEKASRVIFLNKTCYNGLFRVNNSNEFNAPFGRYKNPNIVNEQIIRGVSSFLKANDIQILNKDYASALKGVTQNDFVYFDPPYHPLSKSSSFTGYLQGGFNEAEQERLKEICDDLNTKGIRFLLSNSTTDFIKKLYSKYTIIYVKANRYVNSVAKKRGAIDEVLVKNYD